MTRGIMRLGLRLARFTYLFIGLLASRRLRVVGHSMEPFLRDGDLILITRRVPGRRPPRRGDVVAFRDPLTNGTSIKRICGLPGESLRLAEGALIVQGETLPEPYAMPGREGEHRDMEWTVGADEYVLLGDNRGDSRDSRAFGPVRRSAIMGRAWFRYAPADRSGRL